MTTNTGSPFIKLLSIGRALDLHLPDSLIVEKAYIEALDCSAPWLFNHVVRSWLYSTKLAQARSLQPDAELLAVAVLLHDLGLAQGGAADRRFEVLGADLGRKFALEHGMAGPRAETLWDAIALHTTASIAHFKGVDVACCQLGISCDYGALGYAELLDDDKKTITEAFPRLQMKKELSSCLCQIADVHPQTTFDNFVKDFGELLVPTYKSLSFVDILMNSPFDE